MDTFSLDMFLAYVAAAFAAGLLAYLLVRAVLPRFSASAVHASGEQKGSGLRSFLAPFAAFVVRRRAFDPALAKRLDDLDKLVRQANGTFLDGASGAEIFVARYVFPVCALVVLLLVSRLLALSGGITFLLMAFFGLLLFFWPESGLKAAAAARARRFTRDLPAALDVMRLISQSGGDLFSGIAAVVEVSGPGPVREELVTVQNEVALGTSLAAALAHVAERVGTPEANAVFSTLSQSLEMGTSVADNLGAASLQIRHAARVRAQAKAQKAVVEMSFPLLLLILPGVFIVLLAPLVISFVNR